MTQPPATNVAPAPKSFSASEPVNARDPPPASGSAAPGTPSPVAPALASSAPAEDPGDVLASGPPPPGGVPGGPPPGWVPGGNPPLPAVGGADSGWALAGEATTISGMTHAATPVAAPCPARRNKARR